MPSNFILQQRERRGGVTWISGYIKTNNLNKKNLASGQMLAEWQDHAGCCARASVAMLARVAAVISGERPCSSLMDRVIADIEENDFRPLVADKLKKNAVAGVNKEAALILKLAVKGMHF